MDVNNIAIGMVNVLYSGKNARIEVLAYREQGIWKKKPSLKNFHMKVKHLLLDIPSMMVKSFFLLMKKTMG